MKSNPDASDMPPREARYYQSITEQVDKAIARLEARGFFREEPPRRKSSQFGRNLNLRREREN